MNREGNGIGWRTKACLYAAGLPHINAREVIDERGEAVTSIIEAYSQRSPA